MGKNFLMLSVFFVGLLSAFSVGAVAAKPPRYDAEKSIVILYYTSSCPYSQKVLSYLKKIHKQLPMTNLKNNPQAKAELHRIGGKMQAPCLVVDGKAIYESDAIIEWISQHQDELEST